MPSTPEHQAAQRERQRRRNEWAKRVPRARGQKQQEKGGTMAMVTLDRAAVRAEQERRRSDRTWQEWRHRLPAARQTPVGWKVIREGEDGCAYVLAAGRHATVIETVSVEDDGRVWHHVSTARRDRDPTWAELIAVKEAFIGDRYAYLVAPPRRAYVNLHAHCLHWWSCLDVEAGAVLPEFSSGVGSI